MVFVAVVVVVLFCLGEEGDRVSLVFVVVVVFCLGEEWGPGCRLIVCNGPSTSFKIVSTRGKTCLKMQCPLWLLPFFFFVCFFLYSAYCSGAPCRLGTDSTMRV